MTEQEMVELISTLQVEIERLKLEITARDNTVKAMSYAIQTMVREPKPGE